jgi:hypothetical protein
MLLQLGATKIIAKDPLINEFDISVKEHETVSRCLCNFSFKTTQMFRDINFKLFKKLLSKNNLKSIIIDIDSSVINVEGHQEGALKCYEYLYFFFVTNTDLTSEEVATSYEKRGNCENYIKEAKYDMSVGHLLLKSFWANEAVFQLMMLSYNLFLLFKFDSSSVAEYRQQIKTFRLKYVFIAAKIIKPARYVIMKMSFNYP